MTDEEFARDAEAFRAARIGRLTSATGWLTLIARHPLEPGPNPLPIGTATLDEKGRVTLSVLPGVTVTSDGEPIRERVLRCICLCAPPSVHKGSAGVLASLTENSDDDQSDTR